MAGDMVELAQYNDTTLTGEPRPPAVSGNRQPERPLRKTPSLSEEKWLGTSEEESVRRCRWTVPVDVVELKVFQGHSRV